ncbi:MAG: endonuclease MutS2 [Myxococcales bacterium]|nr:endonuclease MutS2 [Myxococcales bacterium]
MSFRVSQKTLERLEWAQILALLTERARTPRGRARLARRGEDGAMPTDLFEPDLAGVRERLAETSEARATLADGDRPPLGGSGDLDAALLRARKGGVLSGSELLEVGSTLSALRQTARFLAFRRGKTPRLAGRADAIAAPRDLESEIERGLDPSGEVRDAASPALATARREARGLAAEIQRRLERTLRDPAVASRLSDTYYTVRNDRYVLPIRADARGGVHGIVHDASKSGTTLFVEPEALVELNNRIKQAQLEIERETLRVLRELSQQAAAASDAIDAGLETLEAIDLAYARAELAEEMEATEPAVETAGVLRLPQLRHPLLPLSDAVPNDLVLGEGFHVLVVSGPNAGGKTVALKCIALTALFARAGLHVPAAPGTRIDLFDAVYADIGDEQDIRESLSTFSAHMANLAEIVRQAGPGSLIALDEIGVGTDPGEGAALAQAILEALADAGARVVATTHYNLLKEMADVDERFANASVGFDPETLAPSYRLHIGPPGSSSATAVAARMGVPGDVIERANALLAHEDRQLDRMLADLAATRAALEHEQQEAARERLETEAARSEYRAKLEALQARRDKLYRSLRTELDAAFRDAHAQIAGVIRQLQREGSAQGAARARARLEQLARANERAEPATGLAPAPDEALDPVDWRFAKAGDPVEVQGGGRGVLLALPDRRGRCRVQVGGARLLVPVARLGAVVAPAATTARPPPRVSVERVGPAAEAEDSLEIGRCDLHGLRVDEALDRIVDALDRAASAGKSKIAIVHGRGTGALRDAVRRYLADSPYVTSFAPGSPEEGGDGVTIAVLV